MTRKLLSHSRLLCYYLQLLTLKNQSALSLGLGRLAANNCEPTCGYPLSDTTVKLIYIVMA